MALVESKNRTLVTEALVLSNQTDCASKIDPEIEERYLRIVYLSRHGDIRQS